MGQNADYVISGGESLLKTLADYCLRTGAEELLEQWDATRNLPLTPAKLSHGSHRKVWWICEKGHEWQAQIKSRVAGCGCPVCAGREIHPHENDLASQYPLLAAQWHPVLNGNLGPDMVTPGSRRKVWWECPLGHVWKAVVYSRTGTNKCGCPICSGRVSRKRLEQYQIASAQQKEAIYVL